MTFISDSSVGSGTPVFDYGSRDYAAVYADLLDLIPTYLPEWTSQSPNDFGIVLLQMFAYVCDILNYYLDRLGGEAFLQTATQASSILNIAAMLGYQPALSVGSTVVLTLTMSSTAVGVSYPVTIPAGTQFSTQASTTQPAIVFTTVQAVTISGPTSATPSYTANVLAFQGETVTGEQVATSDGTVNQIYPLLYSPVSATVPTASVTAPAVATGTEPGFSVFVDVGLGPQEWTYVPTLINSGPASQFYTTYADPNGVFYIVFGDGVNGYVPPLGSPITATYQVNVGAAGNVGAVTINQVVVPVLGLASVTNASAANGGAATESLASIAANAPVALTTLNRAVTIADVNNLAAQVSGVQWASAVEATYQLINLYIAPSGGGAPSSALLTAVATYMSPLVMANTTLTLLAPTYVSINLAASVVIYPSYGNTVTQQAVIAALNSLLSLASTGFGFRVGVGLIYKTILAVSGVSYVSLTDLDRGTPGLADCVLAANEIPVAGTLTVTVTGGVAGS